MIILKMTPIGKRAEIITDDDAKKMLDAGTATTCPGYDEIIEEVTPEEQKQGYLTRNMQPLTVKRGPGRPPKVQPSKPTETVVEDTPAAK